MYGLQPETPEQKPTLMQRYMMSPIPWLAGLTAAGISFSRNGSIPWAFAALIFAPMYLIYIGVQVLAQGGGLRKQLKRR